MTAVRGSTNFTGASPGKIAATFLGPIAPVRTFGVNKRLYNNSRNFSYNA